MAQNRKKILASALAALVLAAKSAFAALNDDGRFDGSDMEQDPVRYAPQLGKALQAQVDALEVMEHYEGFTPEELAEQKATEKKAALKKLQDEAAASLKAMNRARETPSAVQETADEDVDDDQDLEEDLEDDDLDSDDVGTEEETKTEPWEAEQLEGSADLEPVAPAVVSTPAEPTAEPAVVLPAEPSGKPKSAKSAKAS